MKTVGYYMGERVQVLGEGRVAELLSILGDGLADEEDGTVDEYGGHLARVGATLLLTDSDGNKHAYQALSVSRQGQPVNFLAPAVVAHLIVAKHRLHREGVPS